VADPRFKQRRFWCGHEFALLFCRLVR
jgi:hypothetical protein